MSNSGSKQASNSELNEYTHSNVYANANADAMQGQVITPLVRSTVPERVTKLAVVVIANFVMTGCCQVRHGM